MSQKYIDGLLGNWQSAIDAALDNCSGKGRLDEFSARANNYERIQFMLNYSDKQVSWVDDFFRSTKTWVHKSPDKANHHRQKGNEFFASKKFHEAIKQYSQSIQLAPTDHDCLSLAYGNRSAAWFHLHDYQSCVDDVDEALRHGYPHDTSYKLHHRRAQASHKLHQWSLALQGYQHVLEIIDSQACGAGQKAALKSEVQNQLQKISQNELSPTDPGPPDLPHPRLHHGPHPLLPQASSALSLHHTPAQGRHIKATEDIGSGECLVVEQPFAKLLLPEYYPDRCYHCCAPNAVYPCPHCTRVLFCSVSCRSHASYHSFECNYLPLLESVGIAHLSLRVVQTAGVKRVLETVADETRGDPQVAGVSGAGVYESSDYRSVYDFVSHDHLTSTDDLFQYAMTAVLLMRIVESSGMAEVIGGHDWWNNPRDDGVAASDDHWSSIPEWTVDRVRVTRDEFVTLGGALLKHVLQLVCNAHALVHVTHTPSSQNTDDARETRYATAVYPTVSLLNHSCDPNILSSFLNDTIVVKSTRPIKSGEEVFNCYGPHYQRMPVAERKQILQEQYFFDCHCEPCLTQPLYGVSEALRCDSCHGPVLPTTTDPIQFACTQCDHVLITVHSVGQFQQLNDTPELLLEAEDLEDSQRIQDAIVKLEECYAQQTADLYRHNKSLAQTQDYLAKLYATTGNYKKSLGLMEKQLATTQKLYGDTSIEVGHELQKMAEIAFNDLGVHRALLMVDRAMVIFVRHYDPSHSRVQDLVKMKKCLLHVIANK